jgi:hypothetical protein
LKENLNPEDKIKQTPMTSTPKAKIQKKLELKV